MKRCLYVLLTLLFATVLVACGGNGSDEQTGGDLPADATMQICVGSESVWYYQGILNDYVKENNLPFKIKVTGVDTGKYTDSFLLDTTRGADIFVTAHDNLGKLLAGSGTIAPVTDEDLVANIEDTIDPIFQDVIYMSAAGGQSEFYAVPIIKQALVLFYNKDYLSDSDVVSWEKILEVAESKGKLATTYIGSDGFTLSVYPASMPVYMELIKNGCAATILETGAVIQVPLFVNDIANK